MVGMKAMSGRAYRQAASVRHAPLPVLSQRGRLRRRFWLPTGNGSLGSVGKTASDIALRAGYEGTPELAEELRQHVGKVMGPIARPEKVEFVARLPKTRSGKIMRRVLKARAGPARRRPDDAGGIG
ncbi:MAG: hypothetical protein KatS3mg053_3840 [Candidatus Roseilinea sp.]|nr:MAG: hypothetical protein KatS3mg053_3840 [Candidatus Roseilinea sp.]